MLALLPTNILAVVGMLMGIYYFVEWNGLWFFTHVVGLIVSQWLRAWLESAMLKFLPVILFGISLIFCLLAMLFLCSRFSHCAVYFFFCRKSAVYGIT